MTPTHHCKSRRRKRRRSTTNADPRIPQNEWNGMENLNEGGEEIRGEESESGKGNERNRNLEEKPIQDGP